jgi:hypothetical protein
MESILNSLESAAPMKTEVDFIADIMSFIITFLGKSSIISPRKVNKFFTSHSAQHIANGFNGDVSSLTPTSIYDVQLIVKLFQDVLKNNLTLSTMITEAIGGGGILSSNPGGILSSNPGGILSSNPGGILPPNPPVNESDFF